MALIQRSKRTLTAFRGAYAAPLPRRAAAPQLNGLEEYGINPETFSVDLQKRYKHISTRVDTTAKGAPRLSGGHSGGQQGGRQGGGAGRSSSAGFAAGFAAGPALCPRLDCVAPERGHNL